MACWKTSSSRTAKTCGEETLHTCYNTQVWEAAGCWAHKPPGQEAEGLIASRYLGSKQKVVCPSLRNGLWASVAAGGSLPLLWETNKKHQSVKKKHKAVIVATALGYFKQLNKKHKKDEMFHDTSITKHMALGRHQREMAGEALVHVGLYRWDSRCCYCAAPWAPPGRPAG